MNNWKAIGYIFLGFGSVFLGYALLSIFVISSLSSGFINLTPVAIAANVPWFIIAALAYIVGFVGYFAGKENIIQENAVEETEEETAMLDEQAVSVGITPLWSFPSAVLTTLGLLGLHLGLGFSESMTYIVGVPSPVFVSLIGGAVVGIVVLLVLYLQNHVKGFQ